MHTAIKTNGTEKKPCDTTRQGDERIAVKPRCLKLGIDVHWTQYTVVAQFDGTSPRPAQRFTPAGFLAWVAARRAEACEVHSCYEAGAFGCVLHRRLVALGIKNVVVRPRDWDEYHKKVKTDRRDALALCGMLDRHLAGNWACAWRPLPRRRFPPRDTPLITTQPMTPLMT